MELIREHGPVMRAEVLLDRGPARVAPVSRAEFLRLWADALMSGESLSLRQVVAERLRSERAELDSPPVPPAGRGAPSATLVALRALPVQTASALALVVWGQVTVEAAALALGVPEALVRLRVEHGLDVLRRALLSQAQARGEMADGPSL